MSLCRNGRHPSTNGWPRPSPADGSTTLSRTANAPRLQQRPSRPRIISPPSCARWGLRPEDIDVVIHTHQAGQSAAIVSGVRHAHAPWIATLDGDGQNEVVAVCGERLVRYGLESHEQAPITLFKCQTLLADAYKLANETPNIVYDLLLGGSYEEQQKARRDFVVAIAMALRDQRELEAVQ